MARIAQVRRDESKDLETVFEITEAVMGFVPNSMLIMARDPDLLAAFAELSAVIVARPGRLDPGLKALIMYIVSRSAGCQYCVAHSANLAASPVSGATPGARRLTQSPPLPLAPQAMGSEAAARVTRTASCLPRLAPLSTK